MCPSRDRPKQLADLVRSTLHSSEADIAVYIDEDQRQLYRWTEEAGVPERLRVVRGPRIGPVAAVNSIVKSFPGYSAYGFLLDDCTFGVKGWDSFVSDQLDDLPGRIGIVSPAKNSGEHADMGFVSYEWIKALGWYAWPGLYHWGWDAVLDALGEATDTLIQAEPGEFWVTHEVMASKNRDRYPSDVVHLYEFFSDQFGPEVRKLRKAIREAS